MKATYLFSHDTDIIFEQLTNPEFLTQRCGAMGEKDVQCNVESVGQKTTVTLSRTVVRDMPKFISKLVGTEAAMTMVESWEEKENNKIGSYRIDIKGQPVKVTADFALEPSEKGCEYHITFAASAKFPLVGKKIEKFIVGKTAEIMREEMDYLEEKLA